MQFTRPLARKKNLLLCLDAFDTLYRPNLPVPAAYALTAKRHGINCVAEATASKPVETWEAQDYEPVFRAFKQAFKQQSTENPNYGKKTGLGAEHWWANVIRGTFQPFLDPHKEVPQTLISELLTRYSSSEGYTFFPDAEALFQQLRSARTNKPAPGWTWEKTVVGIITNSDDRVPSILSSFGLKVGSRRFGTTLEDAYTPAVDEDINFVVLSYDAGCEKPDGRIFEAAASMLDDTLSTSSPSANLGCVDDYEKLYVGDSVEKDYLGAQKAGWHAVVVDRSKEMVSGGEAEASRKAPLGSTMVKVGGRKMKVRVVRGLDELVNWNPKNRWAGERAGRSTG